MTRARRAAVTGGRWPYFLHPNGVATPNPVRAHRDARSGFGAEAVAATAGAGSRAVGRFVGGGAVAGCGRARRRTDRLGVTGRFCGRMGDRSHPSVREGVAVRTFGTNDKTALIVGTIVLLAMFAAVIGALAARRRVVGIIGVATFCHRCGRVADTSVRQLGGWRATAGGCCSRCSRPSVAVGSDASVGIVADVDRPSPLSVDRRGCRGDRRGIGWRRTRASATLRRLGRPFRVDAPRSHVTGSDGAVPRQLRDRRGAVFHNAESRLLPDRHRIGGAIGAPRVVAPADRWDGRPAAHFELCDLLDRPLVERDITLISVSNEVGGRYTGTARWRRR